MVKEKFLLTLNDRARVIVMEELKTITIEDNEEFLRQISKPVVFPDADLPKDIELLERYFNREDNNTLALATVQLGIPKRLIYLKNTNLELISSDEKDNSYNEKRILINPEIITRQGLTEYWEACASCLDFTGLVERPYKIEVKYQDLNGEYHTEIFEGFESTVLSHEMDHLDGILHIDKAKEILKMNKEERKEFRKTHGYKITSKTGDFERLIRKKIM